MEDILRTILNWSEVWSPLIPLIILWKYKPISNWIEPLKWYLIVALLLNTCIDFMWYVNREEWFGVSAVKENWWNNNILYNIQSIVRIIFFCWFFAILDNKLKPVSRIIPTVFLAAIFIYFTFTDHSIFKLSSFVMASEAGLLLIFCLLYTFKLIRADKPAFITSHRPLWVVGGLTLYTAVNFFIFLFYNYLTKNFKDYAVSIWDIHNLLFIILCVCISIAFYHDSNN